MRVSRTALAAAAALAMGCGPALAAWDRCESPGAERLAEAAASASDAIRGFAARARSKAAPLIAAATERDRERERELQAERDRLAAEAEARRLAIWEAERPEREARQALERERRKAERRERERERAEEREWARREAAQRQENWAAATALIMDSLNAYSRAQSQAYANDPCNDPNFDGIDNDGNGDCQTGELRDY